MNGVVLRPPVNPQYSEEEKLFLEALEYPPKERRTFVERKCAEDDRLREAVLELLDSNETGGEFLETFTEGDSAEVAWQLKRIAPSDEQPGDKIGRYRLLEQIGEGAWSTVWLARQTKDIKREVALKILKLGLDTKDFLARFETERQVMALMDHPHIGRALDAGATDHGRPYLVMELVKGRSLIDYADYRRMSIKARVELFIKTCKAVQYAHKRGIIHRDLKPSNILVAEVDGEPVPKVIDFGVAKTTQFRLTDKTLYTGLRTFMGTPAYCSPEQLDPGTTEVSFQSDIYSLGALLYELLVGRPPYDPKQFSRKGLETIRATILNEHPPTPSQRLSALQEDEQKTVAENRQMSPGTMAALIKADLDWVIMMCLEKEPERRYESAKALGKDLQAYLDGEPVSAAAPSTIYRTRKFITRKRPAYSIYLEVAVILLGLFAVYALFRSQPTGPPPIEFELTQVQEIKEKVSIAVLPFADTGTDPDFSYYATGYDWRVMEYLRKAKNITIAGSTWMKRYANTEKSYQEIGTEVGAQYLIGGSVNRSSGRLRVDVFLVETQNGTILWSETFRSAISIEGLIKVLSEIVLGTASKLGIPLSSREVGEIESLPTTSLEAYDHFLRSMAFEARDENELLEEAVALDPDYYDAWERLANKRLISWRFQANRGDDELIAEAYTALDHVIRLKPDSASTLRLRAEFAAQVDDNILEALKLDLLAKALGNDVSNAAIRYLQLGLLEEAKFHLEEELITDPLNGGNITRLYWVYLYLERWEDARSLVETFVERSQIGKNTDMYHLLPLQEFLENGDLERYIPARVASPGSREPAFMRLWESLARRDLRAALRHIPDHDFYWFQLIGHPGPSYQKGMGFKPMELLAALIWFELGDMDKCLEEVAKAKTFFRDIVDSTTAYVPPDARTLLSICYALEGNRDEVDRLVPLIREVTLKANWSFRERAYTELHIAIAYLILGDENTALTILEAASQMDTPIFVSRELKIWFIFDRLRGNPRFEALLGVEVLGPSGIAQTEEQPTSSREAYDLLQEAVELDSNQDPEAKRLEPAASKTLAVLPFLQVGLDSADNHFPVAIQNTLIDNLKAIEGVENVLSSAATASYQDSSQAIEIVAAELNVSHLIAGSVQRIGEEIQVELALIDPEQTNHIWSGRYELEMRMNEFLKLQSEIAQAIAAQFQVSLSPETIAEIEGAPTNSLQAYDYYLQALEVDRNSETLIRRIEILEQATALDPDYADAWFLIANSMYAWPGDIDPHNKKIGQKIQLALDQLERLLPKIEVMVLRANFQWHAYRDLDGSIQLLHEAESLDSMHPEVNRHLGIRYKARGDLARAEHYFELADEVTPLANIIPVCLAYVHARRGKWDELEEILSRIFAHEQFSKYTSSHNSDRGTWMQRQAYFDYLRTGKLEAFGDELESIPSDLDGIAYQDFLFVDRDLEQGLRALKADPNMQSILFSHYRLFRLSVRSRELLLALLLFRLDWEGEKLKYAYQALGDRATAFDENPFAEPEDGALLAIGHALVGDRERAIDSIARSRYKAQQSTAHYWSQPYAEALIAMAYVVLGEHEYAIEALESAMTMRHDFLHRHLGLWFIYDPLREDPRTKDRFEALLKGDVLNPSLVRTVSLGITNTPVETNEISFAEKSIAVLPLENLSSDPDNRYFADGIHEEILTNLSRIDDLFVTARSSTLQYRDSLKPARQIGSELGVQYIIEGSVRRAGDDVRVSIQLTDTRSGMLVWSETYAEKLEDIFAIQSAIAQDIADRLESTLSPEDVAEIERYPIENAEAYDYFLKARDMIQSNSRHGDEKIALLEKALELDREYTDAWAQLAIECIYWWDVNRMRMDPELLAKAQQAIQEAERLNPDLPIVNFARGVMAYREKQDYDTFLDLMLAVLEETPNFEQALFHLSNNYHRLGRLIESRRYGERIVRYDPLSVRGNDILMQAYITQGMWSRAKNLALENLERFPEQVLWHRHLAEIQYFQNQDIEAFQQAMVTIPGFLETDRGRLWKALQNRDLNEALSLLDQVPAENRLNPFVNEVRALLASGDWNLLRGLINHHLENEKEAQAWSRKVIATLEPAVESGSNPPPDYLSRLAIAYALLGDKAQVSTLGERALGLAAQKNNQFVYQARCLAQLAMARLILGQSDQAVDLLVQAQELDHPHFIAHQLPLLFIFDDLGEDPRFQALLKSQEQTALPTSEVPQTENKDAYDLFLRSKTATGEEQISLLEKAVTLDPDYYAAWVDLAWQRLVSWRFVHHRNDPERLASARDALSHMKRLQPDTSLTLNREATFAYHIEDDIEKALTLHLRARSLGYSGSDVALRYMQLGRLEQARYEHEATLLDDPFHFNTTNRLFWVYLYLGMWNKARALMENYLGYSGDDDNEALFIHSLALLEFLKDGDIEKYTPAQIAYPGGHYGKKEMKLWKALVDRDYEAALEHMVEVDFFWIQLVSNPSPSLNSGLGFKPLSLLAALIHFQLGDWESCLREVEKAKAYYAPIENPSAENIPPDSASLLAICYALEGNREKVEFLMTLVREKTNKENWQFRDQAFTELQFAICYLVLGDHNRAVDILEAASQMKGPIFVNRELELWFMFDRLRGNPRFEALLGEERLVRADSSDSLSSAVSSDSE